LETGYDVLPAIGNEAIGYGLYSYAILTTPSERNTKFLVEVIKSIPGIKEAAADLNRLNIFYIPIQEEQQPQFVKELRAKPANFTVLADHFGTSFYDFRMARAILDHLCGLPPDTMKALCRTDLSRGPYIFTYATPASRLNAVPPPYLFVDLSKVDPRAFGEVLSAFREQVKRDDVTDRARIDTLRLKILQIALTASDWVEPIENGVQHLVSEIVHPAAAGPDR